MSYIFKIGDLVREIYSSKVYAITNVGFVGGEPHEALVNNRWLTPIDFKPVNDIRVGDRVRVLWHYVVNGIDVHNKVYEVAAIYNRLYDLKGLYIDINTDQKPVEVKGYYTFSCDSDSLEVVASNTALEPLQKDDSPTNRDGNAWVKSSAENSQTDNKQAIDTLSNLLNKLQDTVAIQSKQIGILECNRAHNESEVANLKAQLQTAQGELGLTQLEISRMRSKMQVLPQAESGIMRRFASNTKNFIVSFVMDGVLPTIFLSVLIPIAIIEELYIGTSKILKGFSLKFANIKKSNILLLIFQIAIYSTLSIGILIVYSVLYAKSGLGRTQATDVPKQVKSMWQ